MVVIYKKRHNHLSNAEQSKSEYIANEVSDFDGAWIGAVTKELTIQSLTSSLKHEVIGQSCACPSRNIFSPAF